MKPRVAPGLPLYLCLSLASLLRSVRAHGYIAGWAIDGDWVTLPRPSAYFGPAAVSSTRQRWVTGPFYDLDSPDMACGQFNGGTNATITREAKAGAAISLWWLSNWSPSDISWIHPESLITT